MILPGLVISVLWKMRYNSRHSTFRKRMAVPVLLQKNCGDLRGEWMDGTEAALRSLGWDRERGEDEYEPICI